MLTKLLFNSPSPLSPLDFTHAVPSTQNTCLLCFFQVNSILNLHVLLLKTLSPQSLLEATSSPQVQLVHTLCAHWLPRLWHWPHLRHLHFPLPLSPTPTSLLTLCLQLPPPAPCIPPLAVLSLWISLLPLILPFLPFPPNPWPPDFPAHGELRTWNLLVSRRRDPPTATPTHRVPWACGTMKGLIEIVSPQANCQAQLIWNSDWQLHIDSLFPIDAATREWESEHWSGLASNKSLRNELFHWRKMRGLNGKAARHTHTHPPLRAPDKFRSQDQMSKEENFKKREYYRLLKWWFRTRRTLRDYSNPLIL